MASLLNRRNDLRPIESKKLFVSTAVTMLEYDNPINWMLDQPSYLNMFHKCSSPCFVLVCPGRSTSQGEHVVFTTQLRPIHDIDDAMSVTIIHACKKENTRFLLCTQVWCNLSG